MKIETLNVFWRIVLLQSYTTVVDSCVDVASLELESMSMVAQGLERSAQRQWLLLWAFLAKPATMAFYFT